jgi:hypothetical protein
MYCGVVKITPDILHVIIQKSDTSNKRAIIFSVSTGQLLLVERGGFDLTGTEYIWAFVYEPKFDGVEYLHTYYTGDPLQQDIMKHPPTGATWMYSEEHAGHPTKNIFNVLKGNWWSISMVEKSEDMDVSAL